MTAPPDPGEVPGHVLQEPLGAGTTGEVWRGHAVGAPGRELAIKLVRGATSAASLDAVQREAELLDRLSHPSVLRWVAVVPTGEGAALITPLAVGGSLAARIAEASGGLDPLVVADLGARLASALAATHTAGVIHRDVKPANVLFDAEGQPLLGDFGTALLAGDDGAVAGTAEYLDPTVVAGRHPDASSDVYGLGVTLYEALAGVPPYAGSSPGQTLSAADRGRHVPLGELVDAPASLTDAIEAAIRREPDHRPRGAGELAARLDEARRELERRGVSNVGAETPASVPPTGDAVAAGDAAAPPSADPPAARTGGAAPGSSTGTGQVSGPDTSPDAGPHVGGAADDGPVVEPPPQGVEVPPPGQPWSTGASWTTPPAPGGPPPLPGRDRPAAAPGAASASGPPPGDAGRSGTVRYGGGKAGNRIEPKATPPTWRVPRWLLIAAAVAVVVVPLTIVAVLLLGDDDAEGAAREPAPECDDVPAPVADADQTLLADVEGRGCSVRVAWDGGQLAVPDSDGGIERFDLGADPDDVLLFGDWSCDGRESPALYRPEDGRVFTFEALVGAGEQVSAAGEPSGTTGGEPRVVTDGEGCHRIEVAPAD